ncbi:S1/P1 nuclease [Roseateles saccharophilus]|uniref:S1/P1 nuclease n=1 Tax=Roseateles saccharophilus TaxID=304 RepID=A0A4R3VF47_ROSSA|nr:S1/P1 nuclease [Roseateles saccharophilus]MDG0833890.1 S1/P1 Nuclease [Roseateles saccharophilus]TCV02288.1 S1/P1 nuclease [Roseateles saccharophilus]
MQLRPNLATGLLAATLLAAPAAAFAWGDAGHEIVGTLAYQRLTPKAKKAVDALLAQDKDALTKPDFVSRATWADKFRDSDRNTTHVHYNATHQWHFVDIEIDGGTLDQACFGRPALPAGTPASQGQADACVVDKLVQFKQELADPATPTAEKTLALKFIMHFVGDIHQPLHSSDHHDKGGNGVAIEAPPSKAQGNLHAYWDTQLVQKLGSTVPVAAAAVAKLITAQNVALWSSGSIEDWAGESNARAKDTAYNFSGEKTFVDDHGGVGEVLDAQYAARALPVAKEALAKAGVRLANLLNEAFK